MEQENAPTWNRRSTLVSPYLPHESTRSRGNMGGPEGDAVDKSQVVWGSPGGGGGGDAGIVTGELV